MERYIKDGMVGVLYSPGFGSGWAHDSWNDCGSELAMRKEIIEWLYKHRCVKEEFLPNTYEIGFDSQISDFEDFISKELGYKEVWFNGAIDGLVLKYIPCGTAFRIDEYDGAESIEIISRENPNIYYV